MCTRDIQATFQLNLLGILTLLRDRKTHTHNTRIHSYSHFPFSMAWILLTVTNRFMKNLLGFGAFGVSYIKCSSSFTSSVIFHLAYFIVNYYLFSRNNIGKVYQCWEPKLLGT